MAGASYSRIRTHLLTSLLLCQLLISVCLLIGASVLFEFKVPTLSIKSSLRLEKGCLYLPRRLEGIFSDVWSQLPKCSPPLQELA